MRTSRFRRLLHLGAFMRKEIVDIVRQPRLLLTLVLGPFLIMAIFGLGYRDTPPALRTVFIAPEGSPFLEQVEQYADDLDSYVRVVDIGSDGEAARRQLVDGDIDLIVTFPDDPLATVLAGERAPITVVHTRLDPIEQTAIDFAARLAVNQINGEILARVVGEGQTLVQPAGGIVDAASAAVSELSSATDAGDTTRAEAALDDLDTAVGQLGFAVRHIDAADPSAHRERCTGRPERRAHGHDCRAALDGRGPARRCRWGRRIPHPAGERPAGHACPPSTSSSRPSTLPCSSNRSRATSTSPWRTSTG